MELIKSNHYPSQYLPLDHAEMKSQPFKLAKITTLVAVPGGYGRFFAVGSYLHFLLPMISYKAG
ncbi:hypothetical protein Hanom_Chr01g00070761 [Helianthus anomalus]